MYVEERVEIDAPPERVWEVMADVERWHEWTASITAIERRESGPLRLGASARVTQPKVPSVVWVVTDLPRLKSMYAPTPAAHARAALSGSNSKPKATWPGKRRPAP